ncbi:MAG: glycosyltransferase family 39 protein [Pirellulales bacterium]
MASRVSAQASAADSYPNQLSGSKPLSLAVSARPYVLVGLVLLCLVPRTLMAWRIQYLCPDGVFYVQLADALDHGDLATGLQEMHLNTFPVVLMFLHRLGLEWELAGKVWGVLISSLAVLPMYGWARRQFDDRVALAACFLYACHPKMIEWSPELIREPTFWFLFMLSIYLLWRAVTEVRPVLFVAAGFAITLASLTRFEGLFLLIPLVLWSLWRWLALREARTRLVLGLVLSVVALPALLALVNLTWLHQHSTWEFSRLKPLALAESWLKFLGGDPPSAEVNWSYGLAQSQERLPTGQMLCVFLRTMERGFTPLFALMMLGGLWTWRKVWKRRDHQALFYTAAAILAGIWIHLWCAQASSSRYALSIVLMGSAFAALGFLGASARIILWADRWHWAGTWRPVVVAAPWIIVGVAGCADALSSRYDDRVTEARLGQWANQRFGPSPLVMGPHGLATVANYYARGRCLAFPKGTDDEPLAAMIQQYRPDVVLLGKGHGNADQYQGLLTRTKELGLEQVDSSRLPPGCERVLVLAKDGAAARVAEKPVRTSRRLRQEVYRDG